MEAGDSRSDGGATAGPVAAPLPEPEPEVEADWQSDVDRETETEAEAEAEAETHVRPMREIPTELPAGHAEKGRSFFLDPRFVRARLKPPLFSRQPSCSHLSISLCLSVSLCLSLSLSL